MADRPSWHEMWPEVPEGHEVVAIIDPEWEIDTGKPCRYARQGHYPCGQPSAASLLRGWKRKTNWAYCPAHMYGRWVEDGFVMHWILAAIGKAS
jgi:hypothetical protein